MDWTQFLRGEMGWASTAALAVELGRRVLKGDLVLKREYTGALDVAAKAVERADKLVDEANDQAAKTIEAQAKVIEVYEQRGTGR